MANLKGRRFLAILLSLLISSSVVVLSFVTVIAYSSDEDPLVTLSYLNNVVIPQLKDELSALYTTSNDDGSKVLTDENSDESTGADVSLNSDGSAQGTYETIELNAGDTLSALSALEIIVRPGSIVTAVSPFEHQGVADITNGVELYNDDEFSVNAYCIIPRGNDGRGLYVISEKAYILIRGEYEID